MTTTITRPPAAVMPVPFSTVTTNLIAIISPFIGLIAAMCLSWGWGFSWTAMGIFIGMYAISGFGITIGYHRLFTHRSFDTFGPIKSALAIFGSMAAEGPVLRWVAIHRRHHQHSDHEGDPHSPHLHGHSILGVLRGFWHAHVGWIFQPPPENLGKYVGDLQRNPNIAAISRQFGLWVLVGLLLPTILGGLITMSWWGALLGFIWGGLVRIFLVHHVTWSVNSICHIWGSRPFDTGDDSRNNPIFGILALGEGWHNNHHAFPTSARHGLKWWQIDLSYIIIRTMELIGLAWDVREPDPERIEAKAHRT